MTEDEEARRVASRYLAVDPTGERTGRVIRHTFDQIYDGRHTGRYRLDQLSKTEKTHIGSLIEINLRREFDDLFSDGAVLDFSVDGVEIDCKYSKDFGGWMIPPEAWNKLLLVCTADDAKSEWSIGVVRATEARMNLGNNRDAKRTLRRAIMSDVTWIHAGADLPENILLHIDRELADQILSHRSGQKRINDLLRNVTGRPIGRGTIATVAQQDDPMKRLRTNGGASSHLASEGILVVGGTYESHRTIARDLGALVPTRSETISLPVVPADASEPDTVLLAGQYWRLAHPDEPRTVPAPILPTTTKK
ncbi:MAG: restriction endonuclease [Actinobacteria bacterium]|nr:restriction endonuclease [Actinomycetota bacterium]